MKKLLGSKKYYFIEGQIMRLVSVVCGKVSAFFIYYSKAVIPACFPY